MCDFFHLTYISDINVSIYFSLLCSTPLYEYTIINLPIPCRWAFWLFLVFLIMNKIALWTFLHRSTGKQKHSILWELGCWLWCSRESPRARRKAQKGRRRHRSRARRKRKGEREGSREQNGRNSNRMAEGDWQCDVSLGKGGKCR